MLARSLLNLNFYFSFSFFICILPRSFPPCGRTLGFKLFGKGFMIDPCGRCFILAALLLYADIMEQVEQNLMSRRLKRARFVETVPQSIQGLTFSDDGDKLALSRSDGNLELWVNYDGLFQKKLRIPGKSSRCVQSITWCGNRLFTGCLSG